MSKMDTDMITISRFITEKQRESGGSGEFTQLTNGLVSAVKERFLKISSREIVKIVKTFERPLVLPFASLVSTI